ncbi:MAG: DoxX family protein [Anaerolineae bacterium]|nr:DoxX family protein [Anaerolineae bacterium]
MNALLSRKQVRVIEEPGIVKFLLSDNRASILWLFVRVWLGYQWIEAASHKIGNPAWVETGDALKGFWTSAVAIPETGRAPISFDWYRSFIQGLLDAQAYTWFAKVIAYGELLVGIALILGIFVGIAAFSSGLMNWNFMMAGSASSNPLLFVAAVGLVLAWKVAGYIGLDYFALNFLGTPWSRDKFIENSEEQLEVPDLAPAAGD